MALCCANGRSLSPGNVKNGVLFWDQYLRSLGSASRVPWRAAGDHRRIIGVEPAGVMGRRGSSDALSTPITPPRGISANWSTSSRRGTDPLGRGSAGAMATPAHASSFTKYAVDFMGAWHRPKSATLPQRRQLFSRHGWRSRMVPASGRPLKMASRSPKSAGCLVSADYACGSARRLPRQAIVVAVSS